MISENDFLKELGVLAFVTRLKRVSDAMLHDGRRLYRSLGMDIEPNWFLIFKLLEHQGPFTVTEIADRIGFAHPSVISIVNRMIAAGYVEEARVSSDSRKRHLPSFLFLGEAGSCAGNCSVSMSKEELPQAAKRWPAGAV